MINSQKEGPAGQYLRTVFNTMPLPTFIVDADMGIEDYNVAAAQLLGPEPELAFHRRGGDALHCIHAEAKGCGHNEPCRDCVIRNSVTKALEEGQTHRRIHKAGLRRKGKTLVVDLLVTATPLPSAEAPRVLLILEDITELLTLRGLIPICSQCKKVRDDQQYWHSIEAYLHSHVSMNLTHGLCPECFDEQMKAVEALEGSGNNRREMVAH